MLQTLPGRVRPVFTAQAQPLKQKRTELTLHSPPQYRTPQGSTKSLLTHILKQHLTEEGPGDAVAPEDARIFLATKSAADFAHHRSVRSQLPAMLKGHVRQQCLKKRFKQSLRSGHGGNLVFWALIRCWKRLVAWRPLNRSRMMEVSRCLHGRVSFSSVEGGASLFATFFSDCQRVSMAFPPPT
jgi:hypothetical protein